MRRVETGLVPILRQVPGFKAYYVFGGRADGAMGSVSLFESEEAARTANEKALAWAKENLAGLVESTAPEVLDAKVLTAITA